MAKKKVVLFAISIICIVAIFVLMNFLFFAKQPVESKEEAIVIAKEYVQKKYNHNFNEYEIRAEQENDIWVISYGLGFGIVGGGGPEVHIKKSSGRIIYCSLQM